MPVERSISHRLDVPPSPNAVGHFGCLRSISIRGHVRYKGPPDREWFTAWMIRFVLTGDLMDLTGYVHFCIDVEKHMGIPRWREILNMTGNIDINQNQLDHADHQQWQSYLHDDIPFFSPMADPRSSTIFFSLQQCMYMHMFIAAEIDRLGYGHVILVRSRLGYTLDHQPQIFSISPCFQESRLGRSLRWNVKTGAMYVATMFCDLLNHWASVTMDCHLYMGQFTFGSNHYSVVQ